MELTPKKLTIAGFVLLLSLSIAMLVFSNLTEDVSNMLTALEQGKSQSKELNPNFDDSDTPPYLPDNPEAVITFWEIDTENFKKGEYIGIAVIKEGEIYVNVKYSNLKAILKNNYRPIEITIEGAELPYQPGTTAHLKAIAKESWRWQYAAEYTDR
ncbi:MAG: hypothetical protein P9X27_01790 [Candidatus Kaelpia aquatica]|nr:hypothetical protein [Candidatus Kaelpia aquatica]